MGERKRKNLAVRILNSVFAFTFIGVAIYILFAGFELVPSLILLSSICGLSAPVAIAGSSEGILEFLAEILEAFVSGIVGLFEAIGNVFN